MKNTKDFQPNGNTKIFKLKESATKIYEIPSKKSKLKESQEKTEDYSDKKLNYDSSDIFNCFDE